MPPSRRLPDGQAPASRWARPRPVQTERGSPGARLAEPAEPGVWARGTVDALRRPELPRVVGGENEQDGPVRETRSGLGAGGARHSIDVVETVGGGGGCRPVRARPRPRRCSSGPLPAAPHLGARGRPHARPLPGPAFLWSPVPCGDPTSLLCTLVLQVQEPGNRDFPSGCPGSRPTWEQWFGSRPPAQASDHLSSSPVLGSLPSAKEELGAQPAGRRPLQGRAGLCSTLHPFSFGNLPRSPQMAGLTVPTSRPCHLPQPLSRRCQGQRGPQWASHPGWLSKQAGPVSTPPH